MVGKLLEKSLYHGASEDFHQLQPVADRKIGSFHLDLCFRNDITKQE